MSDPQYGFTGSVNLSVSGLPSGVTASLSPNPTTGYSALTLTVSSTAPIGTSTLTITGTSGNLTATTTVTLGIFAPTFTLYWLQPRVHRPGNFRDWVHPISTPKTDSPATRKSRGLRSAQRRHRVVFAESHHDHRLQ